MLSNIWEISHDSNKKKKKARWNGKRWWTQNILRAKIGNKWNEPWNNKAKAINRWV